MNRLKWITYCVLLFFLWSCSGKSVPHNTSPIQGNPPKKQSLTKNAQYMTLDAGRSPLSPMAADFNRDGYTDIAVVSHGDNQLKIFWGGPNRTFKPGPVYGKDQVGYHPGKITIVDWNKDGRPDILLACEGAFQVQYWENNGLGFSKKAVMNVPINCKDIKTADLDKDGHMDIILGPYLGRYILILWGKSSTFSFSTQTIPANPRTRNIELGDWNNDGKIDIFWVEMMPGSVVVAINNGNRHFVRYFLKKPGKPIGLGKDGPDYVKTGDLNGDGCTDAAATFEVLIDRGCIIFYGDCKGKVANKEYIAAPVWGFRGLALAAGSKKAPPMLAIGEEQRIFIAKKSAGKWNLIQKPAGSLPKDLIFYDIDLDGNKDLLFANGAGETIGILFGPF